ncbi:MAG: sel1 repeat family protein [Myxococcales bacterium]|nr:sel1 repeat family protein [Myxococcales bacterium]
MGRLRRIAVSIVVLAARAASADVGQDVFACDGGDARACERACKAGEGVACTQRGLMTPAQGKSWWDQACTAGETYGCKLVAQLAEKATPQDLPFAAATYRKACGMGSETSCARIGMSREDKVPPAKYPTRLVDAIRAACSKHKHAQSCTELGALYLTGNGVAIDEATGLTALDGGCSAGELWACSNLGIQLGRAKDSAETGVTLLDKACTGGIAHACFHLALALHDSQFVPRDPPRAAKLAVKACDLGHALACASAGRLYDTGDGVAKDPKRALALYTKSCSGLAAGGCVELGLRTDGDRGGAADYKVAIDAYTTACDRGHVRGCTGLAIMLHKGSGVAKDLVRARALYTRACDKKSGAACNNLGVMWKNGEGGAKDPTKAPELYKRGCEHGNGAACINHANVIDSRAPLEDGCTKAEESDACAELGRWLVKGTHGAVDRQRGLTLLDQACKDGVNEACADAAAARK